MQYEFIKCREIWERGTVIANSEEEAKTKVFKDEYEEVIETEIGKNTYVNIILIK